MVRHLLSALLILCSLQVFAQEDMTKVNFSKKFRKANEGTVKIEINEVKELLHIMIAITESGLENDDMVDQSGEYYKAMIQHFQAFKNEPIILTIDSMMKANPLNYVFLTGNALSYRFKKGKLLADKTYLFPAQEVSAHTRITVNPITTYKAAIEQFARKSGFRQFYQSQKSFYKKLIADFNQLANLQQQWNWLEARFTTHVNNYTIMCSPLINSLNYTTTFTDNNFKQVMLVLPPVSENPQWSPATNITFNTRIMFTEIDHNYVGKPTLENKELIGQVFKNRAEWVDTTVYGTEYYPDPERVFNEYMTYGLFVVYCKDQFSPEMAEQAKSDVVEVMAQRGFIRMKVFAENLLVLYEQNKGRKVEDWYPAFISSFRK